MKFLIKVIFKINIYKNYLNNSYKIIFYYIFLNLINIIDLIPFFNSLLSKLINFYWYHQ